MSDIITVHKVRAVYFDIQNGLFVTESEKSLENELFCIPGGATNPLERFYSALVRKFNEDTGCDPVLLGKKPFYVGVYQTQKRDIITHAYEIGLPNVLSNPLGGIAPNGHKYKFVNLAFLNGNLDGLTLPTRELVRAKEFGDFVLGKISGK